MGDGSSTLFCSDPLLDGRQLNVRFRRLYDLFENKLATLTKMNSLGWEVDEEAWFWRRKLLTWEEDQVKECSQLLNYIVLQVGVVDKWV